MTHEEMEQRIIGLEAQVDMLMRMIMSSHKNDADPKSNAPKTGPPQTGDMNESMLNTFSAKQIATVQMVVSGKSTHEMGDILGCAESTAKVHIRGYMRKSNTTTRHKAGLHYRRLIEGMSAETHLELTEVEIDWAQDPAKYPTTTSMLKQKVR
jgi:DNA-binding NarL/FixJ family response regulator